MNINDTILTHIEDSTKVVLFKDLPTYDHNPFIAEILSIKMKNKTIEMGSRGTVVFNSDGEQYAETRMVIRKKVDKEEFVKVFKDQISILFELTKTAQKILTYFIKSLGINKDFVIFDRQKAKEYSGLCSDASIYRGLGELIQKNVIAKSTLTQVYYINPKIIFNGDRLVVINAWEKEDKLGSSNILNRENNWPDTNDEIKSIGP